MTPGEEFATYIATAMAGSQTPEPAPAPVAVIRRAPRPDMSQSLGRGPASRNSPAEQFANLMSRNLGRF